MEILQNNNNKTRRRQKTNGVMAAVVLIAVGIIFLGKNLGYIDRSIFKILVSWQMLLVALGTWSLIKRQYSGGLVLLIIGMFFLIPHLTGWMNGGWVRTYWPILLIAIGVILIVRKMLPQNSNRHNKECCFKEDNRSENGYLHSDTMFGSVKHIILDPSFKGASVKNSFAGTIIDLRGTKLDATETFIDVDCLFGGIEIHVHSSWYIISEAKPMFGGYEDKRFNTGIEVDYAHKLIIRGNLTFSGLDIKN